MRFGRKPLLLQRANRLKPSEHANHAVIFSRVGNRVDVRTRTDCRSVRLGTSPTRKNISDCAQVHFIAIVDLLN